jgi:hypothetical protein
MRFPALIAVPAIALALAGCSAQEPATQPTTSTEVKSLFSSDEEALAAAEATYANYLQVSDQIARDGGANPERLIPILNETQYQIEKTSFDGYVSKRIHASGDMRFDSIHLASSGQGEVSVYLCLDSSQSRVIDASNNDVTPSTRVDRWPLLVSFQNSGGRLILSGSETWTGTNFC